MTPRHPITPAPFDPHAHIDTPAQAWSDPEISRLSHTDDPDWISKTVARHKAERADESVVVDEVAASYPPIPATAQHDEFPMEFPSKGLRAWIIFGCCVVVGLLFAGYLVTNMQGAS